MKLSLSTLSDSFWQDKGYHIPTYDVQAVNAHTADNPRWLHLGAGNLFRAYLANLQQRLLNDKHCDYGIIVAEGFDPEIIDKVYAPYDNLCVFAKLKNDQTVDKILISSICESLRMDRAFADDFARLEAIIASPSLQIVSLTITEKGYQIQDNDGQYLPHIKEDFQRPLKEVRSYLATLTALLYTRYQQGAQPLAIVSMDNVSKNGEKLAHAILTFARHWQEKGTVDQGFIDYLLSEHIAFPQTMIDKITPRPAEVVLELLQKDGLEAMDPVLTSKNTYIAPFVNAEELEYLVIEDRFPNGRPPLDLVGVMFASKEVVNQVETMKVTTCLNPVHTALAIFGCLLGYERIYEEMRDLTLLSLAKTVGYQEGLPVVVDPKILNPKQFIDEVIEVRLPNPFMPDSPQRIATDTSQKLAIRFGHTIRAYQASNAQKVQELVAIPLVFAGWLRYLLGVDDKGQTFVCSADPLLKSMQSTLAGISVGEGVKVSKEKLLPILQDSSIFGVNLESVGLADKVHSYFEAMLQGEGAVRRTLNAHLY